MPDFKFSCPGCGQHIQCDTGYAGHQISCPACKQAIIVPQASASAPPPPPALAPRLQSAPATSPPTQRYTGTPGAAARPPKKSNALKIVLSVAVFLVCAALGFFGFQYATHGFSGKAKPNPAAQVAAPSADQAVQALSILSKVHQAYTNVTTLKAEGTLTLYLNLSNITTMDVNPETPADSPNAKRHPRGMPRVITNTTAFTVRQEPSNLYYFAGEAVSKIDRQTLTNTIAYWSSDKGRFMYSDPHQMRVPVTYMQLPDANAGPNTAEQIKQMQQLFSDPANLTKIIKDLGQTEDDTVNGQDCYTLTAKVFGQKVKIWVDKSSYLIPQWQITLGGLISDGDLDDAFSVIETGYTNVPPMVMDGVKMQIEKYAPAIAKIRGTIAATTDTIDVNPTFTADDFNYAVPPGTKLTKLPNTATRPRPTN